MATPQNPEIRLGFGARPQGNAVALFGADIFVVGADEHSDIQQSLYSTDLGFASATLGNKSSWSNSRLTLPNGFAPQTKAGCALASQRWR